MINIYLFNYAKKENSTAKPSTDTGTRFRCAVKTGSSMISPVVEISTESLPGYNYAYIPNFNRWYYVTNLTYERGLWVLSLACDVLATYKDGIGALNEYVTRSSYSFDTNLIDRIYPAKANFSASNVILNPNDIVTWASGTFAVNVVNAQSLSGYVTYLFTAANFSNFLAQLSTDLTDSSVSVWDSVSESIKITSYEPLRYIGSIFWFPESMPAGIARTTLKLGNYEVTNISCVQPSFPEGGPGIDPIDIPKHPQAATRGQYLNLAPYSEYTLSLGPFGNIKMDTTALYGKTKLHVNITTDYVTGSGRVRVTAGTGLLPDMANDAMVANTVCQYGVPVRINSMNSFTLGSMFSIVGGIAGVAGGIVTGDADAAVSGFNSAVSGVESLAKGSFDSVGSTGSISDHIMKKILYTRFWNVTDENRANFGRPLCQNSVLNTLPGFIQVQRGHFASAQATRPETDAVNAYLEGGFFYE